ncbi:MAG TPA: NACHT domain-containing protein [Anaerolineae bacterium]|nr:NACHT domain-containing protein [Anaerolineae bacterium]
MWTVFRHRWDWLSLGAGFLLGLLFHVVLRLLQVGGQRVLWAWQRLHAERTTTKEVRVEQRYRQWLRSALRGWHLAAPLFALDEILIPPAVLRPPRLAVAEESSILDDMVTTAVPFSPEWPHLQAFYQAPTLTLPQALSGGAHLLLLGPPGMGKTTALLYLAGLLLQRDPALGDLADRLPLYTHAAALALPEQEAENPGALLTPLMDALPAEMPAGLRSSWARHLEEFFQTGRLVWLLDGLDELPLEAQQPVARYVSRVLEAFPQVRVVAAAAPDFFDGFSRAGLQPVALAPWDERRAQRFLVQWGRQWRRYVAPALQAAPPEVDALLLNRWLLAEHPVITPLELTLHAWAAYAGDALGPRLRDGLEAYLRRMVPDWERARPALQAAALELLNLGQAAVPVNALGSHLDVEVEFEEAPSPAPDEGDGAANTETAPPEGTKSPFQVPIKSARVRRLLPELVQSGLLVTYSAERVGFVHPTLWAYLAGEAIARWGTQGVLRSPWWPVKLQALRFAAALGDGTARVEAWLVQSKEPLLREVRWLGQVLPDLPANSPLLPSIVRRLMDLVTDPLTPVSLRADALSALVLSGEKGMRVIFRKLLAHRDAGTRRLAALGCGLLRDGKAVEELRALLLDEALEVQRAVTLALAAIGSEDALRLLGELLLHGNDLQRRAAAEALANHPQEGHPALQEGAQHEDLLVRRAVAYGLARVPDPWAREALEKMQVEDDEWVVQAAAAQVLEALQQTEAWAPRPRPPLHDEPWLLAFAAERGVGVPPGEAAYDVLRDCLREGSEEQVLAALERVAFEPHIDWTAEVYALFYGGTPAQQEAASLALRYLAAAGAELPNPMRYGLGRDIRR